MTTTVSPREQIVEAVRYCRKSRHYPNCRCGTYQGIYCTSGECTWTKAISRLIDDCLTDGA